jgi:hypothetical protein
VAVPNVTAIDWKQADVFGPGFDHQGGMSFTVQEARAAFCFSCCTCPLHVGVVLNIRKKQTADG